MLVPKRSLLWIQIGIGILCLLSVAIYLRSIPVYYEMLRAHCILEACDYAPAPPTTIEELQKYHLSVESYALLFVIADCLLTLCYYTAAGIVLWKSAREPMGLLGVLMLVTIGTIFPSVVPMAGVGSALMFVLGWSSFVLFFFLFPNGRFVPKWTAGAAILYIAFQGVSLFISLSSSNELIWPVWVKGILLLLSLVIIVVSQLYRYRRVHDATGRQQTKWVVYGFALSLSGFILINLFYTPSVTHGALSFVYLNVSINLVVSIIPVVLTIAILRHRLWGIDPLVNRTLVYAGLSVCVTLIYMVVVSYMSRLFHTSNNLLISLAATGLVAVLFAPLKNRLQRMVNRMMYGKKDEPFSVLADLSRQWEKPMSSEAVIEVVVQMIRESMRLPYAEIAVHLQQQEAVIAASGTECTDVVELPIIHRGERLGALRVGLRSPGEAFTTEDRRLLDVLIRQAGPIVEGVKMSVGLKRLAEDVQESREKLILAREEERRKLRRNLHDDLAPRLAALALNVGAAEKYVRKDPDAATVLLSELKQVIRSTVNDIRTLVHDLRPPTLDEYGLVGAIRERIHELTASQRLAETMTGPTLQIHLETTEEPLMLPAAVEVAAYRIVTESLVNVVRHSQATHCLVRLQDSEGACLLIEVIDNGIGIGEGRTLSLNGGIGTVSMREQARELGGNCTFEQRAEGGAKVLAVLPYEWMKGRNSSADLISG